MVASREASKPHRAAVLEALFGSGQALQRAESEMKRLLEERGIFFGEGLLPTYAFAYVAPREQIRRWGEQAELVIAAADFQAREAVAEATTSDTQVLDQESRDLIFAYPGYDRVCVICRPDGIPVGNDLRFVELNCDSPAMMMFLDVVTDCVLQLDAFASMRDRPRPQSLADHLLETLVGCYREAGNKDTPTIAIMDWEGQKTRFEHQRLAEHFMARGYPTVVCDPRSFRRVGGDLHTADGRKVDLVYRRALVSEIIARQHEIEPLLQAYRDTAICMVNPLSAYVASAKSLLTRIVANDLPPALQGAAQLVPRTLHLDDPRARKLVQETPGRWVLKKSESHGGGHVILPGVATDAEWRQAMEASRTEGWIAQDYLDVPRISVPAAHGQTITSSELFYNWNPFVFGGRYAGGLVRTSNTPLINITQGGGLLPTWEA
jgi:hypothetical protein